MHAERDSSLDSILAALGNKKLYSSHDRFLWDGTGGKDQGSVLWLHFTFQSAFLAFLAERTDFHFRVDFESGKMVMALYE